MYSLSLTLTDSLTLSLSSTHKQTLIWEQVRVARVIEHVPKVNSCVCLAISGSKLLCGGDLVRDDDASDENDRDNVKKGFLMVLDYEAMNCEHTLLLDYYPWRLLSLRAELWSLVDDGSVVVLGKAERGEGGQGA